MWAPVTSQRNLSDINPLKNVLKKHTFFGDLCSIWSYPWSHTANFMCSLWIYDQPLFMGQPCFDRGTYEIRIPDAGGATGDGSNASDLSFIQKTIAMIHA